MIRKVSLDPSSLHSPFLEGKDRDKDSISQELDKILNKSDSLTSLSHLYGPVEFSLLTSGTLITRCQGKEFYIHSTSVNDELKQLFQQQIACTHKKQDVVKQSQTSQDTSKGLSTKVKILLGIGAIGALAVGSYLLAPDTTTAVATQALELASQVYNTALSYLTTSPQMPLVDVPQTARFATEAITQPGLTSLPLNISSAAADTLQAATNGACELGKYLPETGGQLVHNLGSAINGTCPIPSIAPSIMDTCHATSDATLQLRDSLTAADSQLVQNLGSAINKIRSILSIPVNASSSIFQTASAALHHAADPVINLFSNGHQASGESISLIPQMGGNVTSLMQGAHNTIYGVESPPGIIANTYTAAVETAKGLFNYVTSNSSSIPLEASQHTIVNITEVINGTTSAIPPAANANLLSSISSAASDALHKIADPVVSLLSNSHQASLEVPSLIPQMGGNVTSLMQGAHDAVHGVGNSPGILATTYNATIEGVQNTLNYVASNTSSISLDTCLPAANITEATSISSSVSLGGVVSGTSNVTHLLKQAVEQAAGLKPTSLTNIPPWWERIGRLITDGYRFAKERPLAAPAG